MSFISHLVDGDRMDGSLLIRRIVLGIFNMRIRGILRGLLIRRCTPQQRQKEQKNSNFRLPME